MEQELAQSLKRLLACPDLNLDELEEETKDAIMEAECWLAAYEKGDN